MIYSVLKYVNVQMLKIFKTEYEKPLSDKYVKAETRMKYTKSRFVAVFKKGKHKLLFLMHVIPVLNFKFWILSCYVTNVLILHFSNTVDVIECCMNNRGFCFWRSPEETNKFSHSVKRVIYVIVERLLIVIDFVHDR